jgi:hypothetical protein
MDMVFMICLVMFGSGVGILLTMTAVITVVAVGTTVTAAAVLVAVDTTTLTAGAISSVFVLSVQ